MLATLGYSEEYEEYSGRLGKNWLTVHAMQHPCNLKVNSLGAQGPACSLPRSDSSEKKKKKKKKDKHRKDKKGKKTKKEKDKKEKNKKDKKST